MRDRAIRYVLTAAVLTTVATSAPEGFVRDDLESAAISPLDVITLRVVFSTDTSRQAESMEIRLAWSGATPITLVPDDPGLPTISLAGFDTIDALAPCSLVDGPCELVFTLDAGDAGSGQLEVTAIAERGGDPSFCFPDNRDFQGDATVDVILE